MTLLDPWLVVVTVLFFVATTFFAIVCDRLRGNKR
jgi:hypothetical protein